MINKYTPEGYHIIGTAPADKLVSRVSLDRINEWIDAHVRDLVKNPPEEGYATRYSISGDSLVMVLWDEGSIEVFYTKIMDEYMLVPERNYL